MKYIHRNTSPYIHHPIIKLITVRYPHYTSLIEFCQLLNFSIKLVLKYPKTDIYITLITL